MLNSTDSREQFSDPDSPNCPRECSQYTFLPGYFSTPTSDVMGATWGPGTCISWTSWRFWCRVSHTVLCTVSRNKPYKLPRALCNSRWGSTVQSYLLPDLTNGQTAHETVFHPAWELRFLSSVSMAVSSQPRCEDSQVTSFSLGFISSEPGIKAATIEFNSCGD